jgi:hypothetical protein
MDDVQQRRVTPAAMAVIVATPALLSVSARCDLANALLDLYEGA